VDGWKSYLFSSEAKFHKILFAKEYSEITGKSLQTGTDVFEQAFSAWLRFLSDKPKTQLSWKDVLKKIIPELVLEGRQKIVDSPVKLQNKSMHIYQNTPGFPWTDIHANADWQKMKAAILNFS